MTALQILTAALKAELVANKCTCQSCGDRLAHLRAALEAAAKAPGLNETITGELRAQLTALIRQCSVGTTRWTMEPVTSEQTLGWILGAIDAAYQRGGK